MASVSNSRFVKSTLDDGGASRNIWSREAPTSGYAVGGASDANGRRVGERSVQLSEFGVGHAEAHMRHLRRRSSPKTNAGLAQGSWVEPGKNHVVLDASDIYQSKGRARLEGLKRGERAIYDLNKGQDINLPKRAVH